MALQKVVVAVLFLLGGFTVAIAQNPLDQRTPGIVVEILEGDSLASVLLQYTGDINPQRIEALRRHNNIDQPEQLAPGTFIRIPGSLLPETADSTPVPTGLQLGCEVSDLCFEETIVGQQPVSPGTTTGAESTGSQSDSAGTPETSVATPPDSAEETADAVPQQPPSRPTETADAAVSEANDTQPGGSEDGQVSTDLAESADEEEPAEAPAPRSSALFDVDEDAAVRALERSLVRIDALLLRPGEGDLNLDVFVSNDRRVNAELIELTDGDGQTTTTVGEIESVRENYGVTFGMALGLPFDSQVELEIPVELLDAEDNILVSGDEIDGTDFTASGVGDVRLTLLKTVLREKGRRPDVIARLSYDADTGTEDDGVSLGSGTNEITLGVSATKRQDPLVFTYGISHTIATESNGFTPGSNTGFSVGALLAASPYTSLQFSFNHSISQDAELDGSRLAGTGSTSGNFTFGFSSVLTSSVFMSAGVNFGLSDISNDYNFFFGISKRIRY